MRSLICLLLCASPVLAADVTSWERQDDLTSASLALAVMHGQRHDDSGARWGLVSSSASALPDGGLRLVSFWQWMHPTQLEGDALYRCVDELDAGGAMRAAWCDGASPKTR